MVIDKYIGRSNVPHLFIFFMEISNGTHENVKEIPQLRFLKLRFFALKSSPIGNLISQNMRVILIKNLDRIKMYL